MSDITLPPLPARVDMTSPNAQALPGYSHLHMRDYARAAVLADREQRGEPVAWLTPGQDLHLANDEGFRFSDWIPLYASPQPVEQRGEPYLYVYEYHSEMGLHREFYPREWNGMKPDRTVPLYLAPQPVEQRKPLTDEQWQVIADTLGCFISRRQKDAIESAIDIKEAT